MMSRPDYPIINEVESLLISNKQPTKLFSQTKSLVESKHMTDSIYLSFDSPSAQSQQKMAKINPNNPKSAGKDNNANLRAFIMTNLQAVFSSKDTAYENYFTEKIGQQTVDLIKKVSIKNHNHQEMSIENMIKVISGFLRTLSNKKLKNPEQFQLKKQLETLPIIIDYFIIIFRAILSHFQIQGASDYEKTLKDDDAFTVLSQYFDIYYIKKDNFYFFEDVSLYIFKNLKEYIFGSYNSGSTRKNSQDRIQRKQQTHSKYQNECNNKILQCSMESGSYLVSSRHAEQSTPYFQNVNGDMFLFGSNQRKQNEKQGNFNSKTIYQNPNQNSKAADSKSSAFEVNVYNEQNSKSFNSKYKNPKNSSKSNELCREPNDSREISAQENAKTFRKGSMGANPQGTDIFKKIGSQKHFVPSNSIRKHKSNQFESESLKTKDKSSNKDHQQKSAFLQLRNDKIFQWENEERRLRRVQTICYKTCATCHRRFYRNQLQSNVFEVKIVSNLKQWSGNQTGKNSPTNFQAKHPHAFLNKMFQKKVNNSPIELQQVKNNENIEKGVKLKQTQKSNVPAGPDKGLNLNWLSKKPRQQTKTNQGKNIGLNPQISPSGSPKNYDSKKQYNAKIQVQSPKKVLSIKNLFIQNKQSSKSPVKIPSPNQNKRPSHQLRQVPAKIKSFFAIKSAKQLQKKRSIDKVDFREKISSEIPLSIGKKNDIKLQNTNNSTTANNTNSVGPNDKNEAKRKQAKDIQNCNSGMVRLSKSADKKLTKLIKKDSLTVDFDLIMS